MECNKDEAIRAKQIAEKKMENLDFEGARKIALKAQALYPELENISQLLGICNVHCSAQMRILGAEKDWYGILQVEKLSDEPTVRKQYRKLALNLHPDKNRFPGAEAAFKLIVEANAVLSDPAKKSVYDSRIRAVGQPPVPVKIPPHHMNANRTYQFNRQYGVNSNVPTGFTGLNQHQAAQPQPSHSVRLEMFTTICPFCCIKHQHPRTVLSTMLTCHNCLKKFMPYEKTGPSIPTGVPIRPVASQTGANFGSGNSVSREASQWRANKRAAKENQQAAPASGGVQVENAAKVRVEVKEKRVDDGRDVSASHGQKANGFAENREKVKEKNKSRKRGRKQMISSSESSDSSSDSDLEDVTMKGNHDLNSGSSHGHPVRRSSRARQNVNYTYTEGDVEDDDDVYLSPPKRSRGNKVPEDIEEENKDSLNQNATVHPEESKQAKGFAESEGMGNGTGVVIESEDAEFTDFNKLRDESLFAVNQIWACYDSDDGMPRFHALVKKVSHAPFELSFTWLEPDPIYDAHKKWTKAGLPAGCGSFKLGKIEITHSNNMFSHKVIFEKGTKRGSFHVYPRQGEVWAVFKDWDLNWSSSPENHTVYKYEVVEILTDFDPVSGLKVCYLDKVAGFVSVFKRSSLDEADSFLVQPNQLYKLSHRIPSYKLTGSEKEGVPAGSFELDTASLPLDADDLFYPSKEGMGVEKTGHGANVEPKSV
ncbi:DNAJ heat shock N-terminal domain-containing family protein [Striga asiatica]|uniref:DNAJ heat shock N-terminal domain-containing family protein n=1 Tax=Striga asiatica TaxID=4170 RepID=A0A5A7PT71_STRAF|nr:DNAJ heat shock N-terminal domain-containing family protein [Striga asiatica]